MQINLNSNEILIMIIMLRKETLKRQSQKKNLSIFLHVIIN
jgi:hypothetical protein